MCSKLIAETLSLDHAFKVQMIRSSSCDNFTTVKALNLNIKSSENISLQNRINLDITVVLL